ncbi:unnamed protein product [Cylindrotheca closterium]|uniref:Uncharacterized protein n=1 Tax=Cylindrotheca closterium TaxID=2856 RepID=A0AAD2FJZ5_9STRA|nr:unnamed protein product [Cylindrotheca closterium]
MTKGKETRTRRCLLIVLVVLVFGLAGPLRASLATTNTTISIWIDETSLLPTISAESNSTTNEERQMGNVITDSQSVGTNVTAPITTVAYLVSVTGCTKSFATKIYDFGAVLKKSIDLNSFPLHPRSRYGSKTFVLVTPETKTTKCVKHLKRAGFQPYSVKFPVKFSEIQQVEGAKIFRKNIRSDGCCGEKELIKLHAYSMTDFPVAIHLDLDTLVVNPLDPVIDAMVLPPDNPTGRDARELLFAPELPESNTSFRYPRMATPTYKASVPLDKLDVQAYYTRDYNMLKRGKGLKVGLQGGFIMVKPNLTTLETLVNMVRSGKYYNAKGGRQGGWFRSGYFSHIWGSMTIQGLLAYYYSDVAHDTSIELNRCRFNQIAENPRRSSFDKRGKYPRGTPISVDADYKDMDCRDRPGSDCDDVQCQKWPLEETFIFHFTYCKTPTKCGDISYNETYKDHQCNLMYRKWFDVRKLVSGDKHDRIATGTYYPDHYRGYCREKGKYISIPSLDKASNGGRQ